MENNNNKNSNNSYSDFIHKFIKKLKKIKSQKEYPDGLKMPEATEIDKKTRNQIAKIGAALSVLECMLNDKQELIKSYKEKDLKKAFTTAFTLLMVKQSVMDKLNKDKQANEKRSIEISQLYDKSGNIDVSKLKRGSRTMKEIIGDSLEMKKLFMKINDINIDRSDENEANREKYFNKSGTDFIRYVMENQKKKEKSFWTRFWSRVSTLTRIKFCEVLKNNEIKK